MLKVTCDCGNRAYLESTGWKDKEGKLTITWDTDTMGLECDDEIGLVISCPDCGTVYDILRVK